MKTQTLRVTIQINVDVAKCLLVLVAVFLI